VEQLVQVLREANEPLSANQIYQKLRERDPSVHWTNPAPVFRSYLQRQQEGPDQVIRVGRGLYGLRQWAERGLQLKPVDHQRPSEHKPKTNLDVAEEILREYARPMSVAEIVEQLQARGIELSASRPIDSMQGNLVQSSRFIKVAPRTFDLAERQNVAAKRKAMEK
jgi:hypothetical protein